MLGGGSGAVYADFDGFVVAVMSAVPLMPNAVSVGSGPLPNVPAGSRVSLSGDELVLANAVVDLADAREWNAVVERNRSRTADEVVARSRSLLAAVDSTRSLSHATALMDALASCDPGGVGGAVRELLGRGAGLTPEGDDVATGAAAAVVAFAAPLGLSSPELLAAFDPPDLSNRTTKLSATLLRLAIAGEVAEPLGTILDLGASPERVVHATELLRRLGHSTGRAWCWAAAAAGTSLAG